jgi:hypothetical protein
LGRTQMFVWLSVVAERKLSSTPAPQMNHDIDTSTLPFRDLGGGWRVETNGVGAEYCYKVHAGKVHFNDSTKTEHAEARTNVWSYILHSRFLVIVSSPVIWMCAIPIALADIVGTFYQAVCFPIYGIPKVRRSDYLNFDRHRLGYLNFLEKVNCEYCAYVNGILAYFTEIAARTEQHWCPIRHAGCAKCMHSRYKKFVNFGDAKSYRRHVEEIRQDYGDIQPGADAKSCG